MNDVQVPAERWRPAGWLGVVSPPLPATEHQPQILPAEDTRVQGIIDNVAHVVGLIH